MFGKTLVKTERGTVYRDEWHAKPKEEGFGRCFVLCEVLPDGTLQPVPTPTVAFQNSAHTEPTAATSQVA